MANACSCIPESLDGIDLEFYGYHRSCYQTFTKNLDQLRHNLEVHEEASTSRSPRKFPKLSTEMFPPKCTFCDKLELKVSDKTKRCSRFPAYKNIGGSFKEPTWKQIEPRALEVKLYRLHRKPHNENLFAKEANFHPSCRKLFNLLYITHVQKQQNVETDANQDDKTAAHQNAFSVVLEFVQELVIWPRGHILKSLASKVKFLALASKLQVLENCPVLGLTTVLFFEWLKFCWKMPETSQKVCEDLFFVFLDRRSSEKNFFSPEKKCLTTVFLFLEIAKNF